MTTIITTNIPIPSSYSPTDGPQTPQTHNLPWLEMKVGDSIFIPWLDSPRLLVAHRLNALMTSHLKRKGWKFMLRSTPDGARVWRTR